MCSPITAASLYPALPLPLDELPNGDPDESGSAPGARCFLGNGIQQLERRIWYSSPPASYMPGVRHAGLLAVRGPRSAGGGRRALIAQGAAEE